MASINESSAAITAIYKYYHTDKTQFYPINALSDEYPHALYVVTEHSSVRTGGDNLHNKASIIRVIKCSSGTLKTFPLYSSVDSAVAALTGSGTAYFTGDLARLGNSVYYSSYHNKVSRILAKTSAGDTVANTLYPAGVADPNAFKIISKMDDDGSWSYTAEATGSGFKTIDRSPIHKYWGEAGITFTQAVNDKTSSITFTPSSSLNLEKFEDGTTSYPSDYIYFSVFRFSKEPIADLRIELSTGGFTGFYYWAPITMTAPSSLTYSAEYDTALATYDKPWDAYDFKQNTVMGQWGVNQYDNQLFRFRIPKKAFAYSGTYAGPMWSAIGSIRFTMKGNAQASTSNPAKVTIADLRLVKCPPTPVPYRVQWLSFDEVECGMDTSGWMRDTGAGTRSTFNRHLAKEGVSCLEIPQPTGFSLTPVATINFSTARNFVTFADGVTATKSHLLKMDICTQGMGNLTNIGANWVAPKITFRSGGTEASTNNATVKFAMPSVLRGGGVERAIPFNMANTQWSSQGTIDWTAVTRVEVYGQQHNAVAKTLGSYFLDNLRIERPTARKIVNAFEPIDLLVLDATDKFAESNLNANIAAAVDFSTDVVQWYLKWTKYQTYGYGYAIYPDYEHGQSTLGFASLRLVTNGSKPFGHLTQVDGSKFPGSNPGHDLSKFWIPTWNATWTWNWPTDFGFLSFAEITASNDDEFQIWIASEKETMSHIKEVVIKFHGNDGSNNADKKNFFEHRISGQEIVQALQGQSDRAKEYKEMKKYNKRLWKEFKNGEWGKLLGYFINPDTKDKMNELISRNIEFFGVDRGGWPSAVFKWRKRDMLMQQNNNAAVEPRWWDIRGHTIELIGDGTACGICVDNLCMKAQGALSGTYYYKMMVEDRDGKMSPASDASKKVVVSDADIQLEDIFVPSDAELDITTNKRLYRIGGSSTEWRQCGAVDKKKTWHVDKMPDADLGNIMPEDYYAPPQAKVMKAINNCMYYANVITRFNEVYPYRIYRSEPYCAYRVNEFDEVDLPETKGAGITGIEGYYNNLLIWTSDSLWSCDLALASPPVWRQPEGCIAKRSIAVCDYGVIWLSRNGLMLGDISKVDDMFFRRINTIFSSYTEEQLENAIGFIRGQYYYLFYDPANGKGICCYLPEKLFSELSGNVFNVYAAHVCNGDSDNDLVYYGRGTANPGIYQMFSGATDNGTAITTVLRSKDFTEPGIMHDKFVSAVYIAGANMYSAAANTTANLTPFAYCNQTAVDTMPTISAGGSTAVRAWASKAIQGDWGQLVGFGINGTNRHKITEMVMKIEPEQDAEYHS